MALGIPHITIHLRMYSGQRGSLTGALSFYYKSRENSYQVLQVMHNMSEHAMKLKVHMIKIIMVVSSYTWKKYHSQQYRRQQTHEYYSDGYTDYKVYRKKMLQHMVKVLNHR